MIKFTKSHHAVLAVLTLGVLAAGTVGTTLAQDASATAAEETSTQAEDASGAEMEMLTFSAAQAVGGRLLYQRECATCHGNDLEGGVGPALAGESFSWHDRPVAELHRYIQEFMPVGAPGSLEAAQVTTIIAYLAQSNGLEAGDEPLPIEADQQENIVFAQ